MKTRLGIRLSEPELTEIKSRAALAGVSLSEYIRRAALRNTERPLIVADAAVLRQMHTNLRRIGSNINQIARALNQFSATERELQALQSALNTLENTSIEVSEFIAAIRDSI